MLRFSGLVVPPPGSPIWMRIRGIAIILVLVVALLALGAGIVQLVGLAFGGVSLLTSIWLGLLVIVVAIGVLALFGRRRQAAAKAKRGAPGS